MDDSSHDIKERENYSKSSLRFGYNRAIERSSETGKIVKGIHKRTDKRLDPDTLCSAIQWYSCARLQLTVLLLSQFTASMKTSTIYKKITINDIINC